MTDIGPGDIVICVDASGTTVTKPLTEGRRYCVRLLRPHDTDFHTEEPGAGVLLKGIFNPNPRRPSEISYNINRFRPLKKSDSEIFREMIKIKEDA